MAATLESVFECVNNFVIQISLRWKVYCQLFDSGPDNIALLNASGAEVFNLFQRLALDDVMLALSRLTDPAHSGRNKRKENASIEYLLQRAAASLDQDTQTKLLCSLDRLKKIAHDVRVLRDKALAHSDLHHSSHPGTLPRVLYDDLEGAMNECRYLMSTLGKSLFARTCAYQVIIPFGRGGYDLLSWLRKAHTQDVGAKV